MEFFIDSKMDEIFFLCGWCNLNNRTVIDHHSSLNSKNEWNNLSIFSNYKNKTQSNF